MGIKDFFKGVFNQKQIDRASKGTVRNSIYSSRVRPNRDTLGQPSPEDLNIVLDLYKKDPVVQAAITTRADAILASGWTIDGATTSKESAMSKLEKIGFNYNFLLKAVTNGLLYNHVFIEIERTNGGEPVGLHVLEAPYMEIIYDKHGEISGYKQVAETGEQPFFPVEDIVFMKFNSVSSAVWGEVGLKSLYRTLTIKNQIERFINSLSETNAWRQVMKTRMNDDNIEEFLAYSASQAQEPTEPLVLQVSSGSADDVDKDTRFSVLRDPADLKEFLSTLDYLRTQVLMMLKVPPIMIGLPDSSNRSNSDMQFKSFNIANESFRKLFVSYIEELFSKIGISGKTKFSWNPIDERSEKDDVEIAERLINMGAKPKQVEAFLRSTGLELPDGELFEPQANVQKSMDMFPSRQGKSDGEGNERIGSGEAGTTRQDQL